MDAYLNAHRVCCDGFIYQALFQPKLIQFFFRWHTHTHTHLFPWVLFSFVCLFAFWPIFIAVLAIDRTTIELNRLSWFFSRIHRNKNKAFLHIIGSGFSKKKHKVFAENEMWNANFYRTSTKSCEGNAPVHVTHYEAWTRYLINYKIRRNPGNRPVCFQTLFCVNLRV